MTWGYDVQIESVLTPTSQASILHHAETLLFDLTLLRKSAVGETKPVLFIAHSLGGIVVKDALSISSNEKTVFNQLLPATIGVMFLGTPHRGSSAVSLGKMAFEISKLFLKKPNVQILRGLELESELPERISRSFGRILAERNIKVHSFREAIPTMGMMIVTAASSTIGDPHETRDSLHANHRKLAKISSVSDIKYRRFVSVLQSWIDDASSEEIVQSNAQSVDVQEALIFPDGSLSSNEDGSIFESLRSDKTHARYDDIQSAYQEIYKWLFDDGVGFADWLRGANMSNFFWIQGKPGSGKSTLMKFAIDHPSTHELLSKYNDSTWIVAGHFFHDRGTTEEKSTEGFLQQVLYQLLEQKKELLTLMRPVITELKQRHLHLRKGQYKLRIGMWTLPMLRDASTSIGEKVTSEVNLCLFVDGLDGHDGNHRELVLILMDIAQLTSNPLFESV